MFTVQKHYRDDSRQETWALIQCFKCKQAWWMSLQVNLLCLLPLAADVTGVDRQIKPHIGAMMSVR